MGNLITNKTMLLEDRTPPWPNKNIKNRINYKMRFIKNSFITMITIYNYIFVISKTYLIQKLNKPKGSNRDNRSNPISNRTKTSTLKSIGHS